MVELTARVAIESLLRATDDDATPIIRRLARIQARAFLNEAPTPPTLSEEVEQLREDVAFLLARSGQAGKFTFGGKRWTGVSSNSLVSIAFGEADEGLPSDSSDLAACYRAVMRLPTHRRTDAVFDHLEDGERYVESKYPGSIEWAREDAEWPGRAALAQVKAL